MRMLDIAVVLTVVVASSASVEAAPAKLLLQDLEAKSVSEAEASAITTSTCLALSKIERYDVLCGDDLRTMMRFGALAATFQACEGDDCYGRIGRALKARYVVSGKVSRLGESYILSLSIFDTAKAKAVARTEVKAATLEKLQLQVPEAVSALRSPPRKR